MKGRVTKKITGTVLTAVFAAVICVLSPLTLPIFTLPLTLAVFAICCVSAVIQEKAALSTLLYIIIGAAGVPVFAAFTGGLGVLAGPTGGYILGYIPLALITGYAAKKHKKFWVVFAFSLCGLALLYIIGGVWYGISAGVGIWQVLTAGVFPFIIPDILKVAAGVFCGSRIKKAVTRPQDQGEKDNA